MEEKKKRQYTDAHRRATMKYRQERAQVVLVMSKEDKERITAEAKEAGLSVNQYILNKLK